MLPIFPLNTVLFPGGVLPLRVFETRYMDMVRDCLKKEQHFGVCLIQQGVEVARQPGESATPEAVGCTAEITDWDMKDMGVLNIRTLGVERFRIQSRVVQPNGLILAQVEMIPFDPVAPIESERLSCVKLLASIINELEQQFSDPPVRRAAPHATDLRLQPRRSGGPQPPAPGDASDRHADRARPPHRVDQNGSRLCPADPVVGQGLAGPSARWDHRPARADRPDLSGARRGRPQSHHVGRSVPPADALRP